MQVPPAQLAALQASMTNVGDRPLQPKPMEFMQFAMHEPYFSLQQLTSELLGLTPDEVQQGEELVEQVSLPREILNIAKDRVGNRGAPFMQSLQECMYDPSAANTGVTSF